LLRRQSGFLTGVSYSGAEGSSHLTPSKLLLII
jgi:hypothetical protein